MVTQDKIPEPDNCIWCQEARNCTTVAFLSKDLLDPLLPSTQTMDEYLANLCECGHQRIPSWAEGEDIPEFIPHTKLCIEHTIRWMEQICRLKVQFDSKR
jgi:hypothetical protein